MSQLSLNPLYELLVWLYESLRDIKFETVKDFIIHAPQYYDIWWRRLLSEAPQHILIETGLIGFIIWLMFIRRTVDPVKAVKDEKFTQREVDELIDTWIPEPLVPTVLCERAETISKSMLVIESVNGNYLNIRGVEKPVLNLSSYDFLGLSRFSGTKEASRSALDKYGCGSCGPRGFYGTIDQHLRIEQAVAKFMGTEEAISYSDGASTVSSAIPAFSKKGDLLLIDDACSEPILTGANLSRSTIQFFKHNDLADLESILISIAKNDRRLKRDATQQRRFIVVEGINRNTGKLCPLPELLKLKKQYCYRLIIDESLSFGTMGKSGRGITEHFGIPISEVEIVTVAMDTALASVGGLCIGTREIVDHQRLSGAGYCFSASAPPFLSAAAAEALQKLESSPSLILDLTANAKALREGLRAIPGLQVVSDDPTPVIHVVLELKHESREAEVALILKLADECLRLGLGVASSKHALTTLQGEKIKQRPSLRICANATLEHKEVQEALAALRLAMGNLKLIPDIVTALKPAQPKHAPELAPAPAAAPSAEPSAATAPVSSPPRGPAREEPSVVQSSVLSCNPV